MAVNTVAGDLDLGNLSDDDFVTEENQDKAEEITTEEPAKETVDESKEDAKEKVEEPEVKDVDTLITTLEKEIENTNKRYDSSSKEAKRLYKENLQYKEQLSQFDEIKPVIELISTNKELQDIAKQMIQGTYQANLPEGTIDLDEAARDPNSESAKVLKSLVQREAQALIGSRTPEKKEVKNPKYEELNREIDETAKELKLKDDDIVDVIEFSKTLGFRDMVELYNLKKGKNGKSVDMVKILDEIKQLSKTDKIASNVKSGGAVEVSVEDKVAKMIRESGGSESINELL